MPEPMKIEIMTDHDYIQTVLIGQVHEHMAKGAAHYGPNNHNELGLKGQYADMHRKMQPLKRYMWEGQALSLAKESPREILMDLIGHCLLTISMLDRDAPGMKEREPIITGSPNREDAEKLKAAGWWKENGVWHHPLDRSSQPKGSCDECWGLSFHRDECSQSGRRAT